VNVSFSGDVFHALSEARRPTLELAQGLDMPAIAQQWLRLQFQITRATSATLDFAVKHCAMWDHEDPFEISLCEYFGRKSNDEDGHGQMMASDMLQAGVPAPLPNESPNPFVAEMAGRQFYLLAFAHPAAYLGYIALLEGFVPTMEQVSAFADGSGLPAVAFRTIRMHAGVDVAHRQDLAKILDDVPAKLRMLVMENGLRCAELQRSALGLLQANLETEMRR
jgi:hypothetical protein